MKQYKYSLKYKNKGFINTIETKTQNTNLYNFKKLDIRNKINVLYISIKYYLKFKFNINV